MTSQPRWIRPDVLLVMHDRLVADFGGLNGMRELSSFESALARPQHLYSFQQTTPITELAACYTFGIVQNHPFSDGNKRTAWMACRLFLEINGLTFTGDAQGAFDAVHQLIAKQISEKQFAEWLDTVCLPKAT